MGNISRGEKLIINFKVSQSFNNEGMLAINCFTNNFCKFAIVSLKHVAFEREGH